MIIISTDFGQRDAERSEKTLSDRTFSAAFAIGPDRMLEECLCQCHFDQSHTAQVDITEVGPAQIGSGEVGAFDPGTTEIGSRQVGTIEIRVAQIGIAEVGSMQISIAQISVTKIVILEIGQRSQGFSGSQRRGRTCQPQKSDEKAAEDRVPKVGAAQPMSQTSSALFSA